MLKIGNRVPASTVFHVAPPSVVCWIAPKLPTTHASVALSARTP